MRRFVAENGTIGFALQQVLITLPYLPPLSPLDLRLRSPMDRYGSHVTAARSPAQVDDAGHPGKVVCERSRHVPPIGGNLGGSRPPRAIEEGSAREIHPTSEKLALTHDDRGPIHGIHRL